MAGDDMIWLPVAPSFKGFGAAMVKEVTGASRQAADRLDADMSAAGKKAGAAAGKGVADGVKASAAEVDKASRAVAQARKKEADAAANVLQAEARVAEARQKGAGSEQLARQEANLEQHRRRQESAARQLSAAEQDVQSIRDGGTGRAQAVIRSENQLEKARLDAAQASDRVELAEAKVTELRYSGETSASKIAKAEADLIKARSEQASATDVLSGKEALHAATLEDVEQQAKDTADAVEDAGEKAKKSGGFMSKAADGAKKLAIGLGAAAATGIGVALTKGFSRINQIDQATAKLTGLGHSAQSVEQIMTSASDAVTGTAFGLGDAATVAAATVAAGVKPGQDLTRTLKLVGDAATIAGTDMSTMGSIVNKVATSDMMQMDVANQLMDAGIPILQMVAQEMGVTSEEARKLASDGKVSFETFQNALEAGLGGAALESGNTLQGSLQNLGAAMGRLGESALKPFIQDGKDLIGTLTDWVNTMTGKVGPAVEGFANFMVATVIPALKDTADWIVRNRDWLEPLAVAVAAGAAAWGAWVGAIKLWQTVTKIATGVQAAFNAVMAANPIMLIVIAIAALVAGLVWFFTQTETGKAVWESLVSAFTTGWEWVKEAFASAWAVIQPILSGIWTGIQFVGAIFGTILLGTVLVAWNIFSAALQAVWAGVIKPVWDAFAFVIQWLWTTILQPAWAGMQIAFQALGAFFQMIWASVIQPMWNAFGAGVQMVWNSVIRPAWDAMKVALGAVGAFFQMVWNSVIKPVWDALGAGIRAVYDSVIQPAFNALKSGLESVGSFFGTIVDGIRSVWDQLKGHVARPINFVIDTVWNNGLLAAWDVIAGFLPGLPSADGARLSPVAFAEGGQVPFTSGAQRGKDSVNALLMPNEHVLDLGDVDALGGHGNIYAMRRFLEQGRGFTYDGRGGLVGLPRHLDSRAGDLAGAAPDLLIPGYADGGRVRRAIEQDKDMRPAWMDQLNAGHEYAMHVAPAPYILGASSGGQPGGPTDCSGFMGEIADAITGGPVGQRSWATMTFPDRQAGMWESGLGPGFSVGIVHGGAAGGHTAGTLSGTDKYSAVNVESGGGTGQGATYGGAAVGADHGQFTEHHHLKIGADGAFESAGGPSPAQQLGIIKKKISEILDKALDPIREGMAAMIGEPPPEWLGIPPAALDVTKEGALDTAFEFAENLGDKLRSAYDLAKDVTASITGFFTDTVGGLFRDEGGYIPAGKSIVNNETGKPEAVFNWRQVDKIGQILASVRDLDHLWAVLGELGNLAATGDFTPRLRDLTGLEEDDELVDAILSMRERFNTGIEDLQASMSQVVQAAGVKAATTYRDEALDFFGFKGLFDGVSELMAPPAQQTTTTSPASATTSGITGTVSGADTGLVYGDPNLTYETRQVALETKMPDFDRETPPGSGAERWRPMMIDALKNQGMDDWAGNPEIVDRFIRQIHTESKGDPNIAQQIVDVNGTGEAAGVGLGQAIPATWAAYRDPSLPDDRRNGWAMLNFMARYVRQKYGEQGYTRIGNGIGYDLGGIADGIGFMPKYTLRPERVLSPAQTAAFEGWMSSGAAAAGIDASHWQAIDDLLVSLPSAAQFERIASLADADTGEVPAPRAAGPLLHIENLVARDEDEAMRAAAREARRLTRSSALVGGWRA